jgi:hypothetical protein
MGGIMNRLNQSVLRCSVVLRCILLGLLVSLANGDAKSWAQGTVGPPKSTPSSIQTLRGSWEFRADTESTWKTIELPSPFEGHEGTAFDGIGWYRKRLPQMALTEHEAVFVRFHGAATHTTVWCDGNVAGSHLGGWTPFDCDLTAWIRASESETLSEAGKPREIELLVRVDEMVGHNSQGFLPVFAPHFGGLWRDVELHRKQAWQIDDKQLFAWGDWEKKTIRVQVPIRFLGDSTPEKTHGPIGLQVRTRRLDGTSSATANSADQPASKSEPTSADASPWSEFTGVVFEPEQYETLVRDRGMTVETEILVDQPRRWSPDQPQRYEVQVRLIRRMLDVASTSIAAIDSVLLQTAFRSVTADGHRLLLNDEPLRVRGILNWGYAPPSTAPSLNPEDWKRELQLAKDYGFNLMKFCLWVPPRDYLSMADEMGVLVWMEYPTWHSQWTPDQLPKLRKEFDEFFCYDRNHPSVILRSLTCETGPSADLDVLRALYDRCHELIPGSIVEDDSSWIQWNRVHDFYDDHPYGNNHTWVDTLDRLKRHINQHGHKPLVLGEAIAADTFVRPESLDPIVGETRPFWLPRFFDANRAWLTAQEAAMGPSAVQRLESDSLDYALRMRKYQIETFRREIPDGGYVVSVIRDFPFAAMGLMDFQGHPKWSEEDWGWHGPTMLLLETEGDRRSFSTTQPIAGRIQISGPTSGTAPFLTSQTELRLSLRNPSNQQVIQQRIPHRTPSSPTDPSTQPIAAFDPFELDAQTLWKDPPTTPQKLILTAQWNSGDTTLASNNWDVWWVPTHPSLPPQFQFHASCDAATRTRLESLSHPPSEHSKQGTANHLETSSGEPANETQHAVANSIVVARHFDAGLLGQLESGANVLMLPDGARGGFPTADHWFLRGGPIVQSLDEPWNELHEMLVQLQHFDLSSKVIPDLQWLDSLRPLLMLWDNHDIDRVKTHGLVFATRVGNGLLLVNCLESDSLADPSPAGQYVMQHSADWLRRTRNDPQSLDNIPEMTPELIEGMRHKLLERTLNLTDRDWTFRIDGDNRGLELGWQQPQAQEGEAWKPMRIGKHWESLGYPSLDGWAWYRIDLTVPQDWDTDSLSLWVDGGDDFFEIYANGALIGSAGDIATKRTAFEDRVSFPIPRSSIPIQDRLTLAIRVYDWYGSGGMFRPIILSTTPRNKQLEILR